MRSILHLARAAGLASAYGLAVMSFFYALQMLLMDVPTSRLDAQAIPQPEPMGWLVGTLAGVALATVPLPRVGPWWAWGLLRAAAGTLAIALPVDVLSRVASVELPVWAYPIFWGPLFLGVLLTAVPREGEHADGSSESKEADDARASS